MELSFKECEETEPAIFSVPQSRNTLYLSSNNEQSRLKLFLRLLCH